DTHVGKSGGRRAKDAQLTLGGLPVRPDDPDHRDGNAAGGTREKSAEAVVVRSFGDVPSCAGNTRRGGPTYLARADEGLNLSCQGASRRRLDGCGAAARQALPTTPVSGVGGGPAPRPARRRRHRT